MKRFDLGRTLLIFTILALLGGFGYAIYTTQILKDRYENNLRQVEQYTSQASTTQSEKIQQLVSTALKADTTWGAPQISKITDENQLKSSDKEFFAEAKQDDWIILYPTKKKIVVYRESTNTIIKYGDTK